MKKLHYLCSSFCLGCFAIFSSCGAEPVDKISVQTSQAHSLITLLESTRVKDLALPEQTLQARIAAVEAIGRERGVDESQLEFGWATARSAELKGFKCPSFKKDSASLLDLLLGSVEGLPAKLSFERAEVTVFHAEEKWPELTEEDKKAEELRMLLDRTFVRKVSLPEQTMEARVLALEGLARDAGIDEARLSFVWAKGRAGEVKKFIRPKLDHDSISLLAILLHSIDSTSTRFHMVGGTKIVIFHGADEFPETSEPE